jgi:hypothetical protein
MAARVVTVLGLIRNYHRAYTDTDTGSAAAALREAPLMARPGTIGGDHPADDRRTAYGNA